MKKISFSEDIVFIEKEDAIKKVKKPYAIRKNKNKYDQKQANLVAKRMENELKNPNVLFYRSREEEIVENLLIQYKLYHLLHKIYRLSDNSLLIIKEK